MADLFDLDDLAALLQRTFTDAETAAATVARANATSRLNSMCRRSFDALVTETVTLRSNGRFIVLPKRPVTALTSIYTVAADGTADDLVSGWTFDGIDTIDLSAASPVGLVSASYTGVIPYRVTYTHGYATPPLDISGIGLKMAMADMENPEGHQMERVDDYMFQRSGAGLSGLSDDDRAIVAAYSRRTGSTQVAR